MLDLPGTLLVTKRKVFVQLEKRNISPGGGWFRSYIIGTPIPPFTPVMLLGIKHDRFRTKRHKVVTILWNEERFSCQLTDEQINRFFGLAKQFEVVEGRLRKKDRNPRKNKKGAV